MAESKPDTPQPANPVVAEAATETPGNAVGEESAEEAAAPTTDQTGKKKKNKKSKAKQSLQKAQATSDDSSPSAGPSNSNLPNGLTPEMAKQLLDTNPALKGQFAGMEQGKAMDALRKMDVSQLLSTMSINSKTGKDMSAYKFWGTQPVPRFDEKEPSTQEGVIKEIDPEKVAQQPRQLMDGFEWVVMDLLDEKQLVEVHELLSFHYVEDDEAMFRLNYSSSFLNWALKSPGWSKEWHIGVRASKSQKLVAFISAVPCNLRVRANILNSAEVNFLVVHKKLRGKRLAPVLIEEITRQCYLKGVYQACYTAGTIIPKPITSCRYFHRSLDWKKLYECRFAGLPSGSTPERQVIKYRVPERPQLKGLREMKPGDVSAVQNLLNRYLLRFAMAPDFTEEEISHWLLHDSSLPEQVVWSYVVEEADSKKITDFFTFYLLESTVIGNPKHSEVRAAYMFYYATESAFGDKAELKTRLNALGLDALIMAKRAGFDVMNALTLLDNPLFLGQQKFQAGDGQLHYYLFNYRTAPIDGGVNEHNEPDESKMGGVGLVML